EELLLGIPAHVGEGKNDDRWLDRARYLGHLAAFGAARLPHAVYPHPAGDIAQLHVAQVGEPEVELAVDCLVDLAGDEDPTGLGERFDARRDVDPIAKYIVAVDDDVTDVDADAELDLLLRRHPGIALGHAALQVHRAADGIDDAPELQQQDIAGGLDDATVVFGDLGVDQLAAMGSQRLQRAAFVATHEARVAH